MSGKKGIKNQNKDEEFFNYFIKELYKNKIYIAIVDVRCLPPILSTYILTGNENQVSLIPLPITPPTFGIFGRKIPELSTVFNLSEEAIKNLIIVYGFPINENQCRYEYLIAKKGKEEKALNEFIRVFMKGYRKLKNLKQFNEGVI